MKEMMMEAAVSLAQLLPLEQCIEWDKTCRRGIGQDLHVLTRCPVCQRERWVRAIYLRHGHTKHTFCKRHKALANIQWVTPDEFATCPDVRVDYTQQRLRRVGKTQPSMALTILGICPDCTRARWVLVNGVRNMGRTTRCMQCAARQRDIRGENAPNWRGGVSINNGYRYIYWLTLQQRLSPEEMRLVTAYLKTHRGYYPEHRVMALLLFGPQAVAPGSVVRHLNGNKLDNTPINLSYGTQRQNINDHVTLQREVFRLRQQVLLLSLALIRLTGH